MARVKETLMEKEAAQAPEAVARLIKENKTLCAELAERLSTKPPSFIATCARGSSDHAATYAKYLMEIYLGLPVISHAPSIGSVYERPLRMKGALFIVISQSGHSPDLVANLAWAKNNGALTLALVNQADSPAAGQADFVLPLSAGPEKAVAATKSYIASLAGLLMLTAHLSGDRGLLTALDRLPENLDAAKRQDWKQAAGPLALSESALILGRGLSFGICLEAALKLKECAGIHAEGFSGAEVMHGPLALVRKGLPILAFSQNDATRPIMDKLVKELKERGAGVFTAREGRKGSGNLPVEAGLHPAAAPLAMIQSYYLLVNRIALARGCDPDNPPLLNKITRTV